jgi:hypothetical protein
LEEFNNNNSMAVFFLPTLLQQLPVTMPLLAALCENMSLPG